MTTFVLSIGELDAEQRYPIALYEAPHLADDEAIARTSMPVSLEAPGLSRTFSEQEMIERFTDAIEADDDLNLIGEQLFALLAQGDVGVHLKRLLPATELVLGQTAEVLREHARLVLDIVPPRLRALPWELTRANGRYLFADLALPTSRGRRWHTAPASHSWPLRLMIVVGASEGSGAGQIEAAREVAAIRDMLLPWWEYDFDLNVVKQPTYEGLRTELLSFKPHILHFIGHGGVEGHEGYLELDSGQPGQIEHWTPATIRESLETLQRQAEPGDLRLVVLNACRTNEAARTGSWSVADAFLAARVPAVIAMRRNVAGEDAARFSEAFYGALVDNMEPLMMGKWGQRSAVDVAVVQARSYVLQSDPNGDQRWKWAAPCLQLQIDPDQVLQLDATVKPHHRESGIKLSKHLRLPGLVDRWPQRYKIWHMFTPNRKNIVVISGNPQVGKTSLAWMLMERCVLCGHQLRYIDLRALSESKLDKTITYLDVLHAIQHGYAHSQMPDYLTAPLAQAPFALFEQRLKEVFRPADNGSAPQPGSIQRPERIFEPFRDALEQAIGEMRPASAEAGGAGPRLVLVVDHPEALNRDHFERLLWSELISKFLQRQDIGFVLLTTTYSSVYNHLAKYANQIELLPPLTEFEREQWSDLALEYMLRNFDRRDLSRNKFWELFAYTKKILPDIFETRRIPDAWTPEYLKVVPIATRSWE